MDLAVFQKSHASRQPAFMSKLVLALTLSVTIFLSPQTVLAQGSSPSQFFAKHNQNSKIRVKHHVWARLLKQYLRRDKTGLNRFKYRAVTSKDRSALKAYLRNLQATPVTSLRRKAQYAYWINLYNALTVDVILDHYPVKSIRDIAISPGLFAKGPWGRKLVKVEGQVLSLDDIEHNILRKIWRDKRVHYAVNCASISCPNLALKVYTATNVHKLLAQGASDYINHPRGVRIENGHLTLSKLYKWYAKDFGTKAQLLSHLRHYAKTGLARRLARINQISSYEYDWSLNE